MENNGRRRFLVLCLGGVATAAAAAVTYPVFRYLSPLAGKKSAEKVVIPEAEVPEGGAKFFEFAGAAAVIVRRRGELIALSAVCTHLGCIVQWEKDKEEFLCPCHAGRYAAEGTVISGPPPKALSRLPFAVASGSITVG